MKKYSLIHLLLEVALKYAPNVYLVANPNPVRRQDFRAITFTPETIKYGNL